MTVGMRVSSSCDLMHTEMSKYLRCNHRIVEYATREQAQQAVAQLSNQNLMGRLVYVREVIIAQFHFVALYRLLLQQDREAEPRFTGATGGNRGGFGGGMPGGFNSSQGGYGGPPCAGGRQIYVANVCLYPLS